MRKIICFGVFLILNFSKGQSQILLTTDVNPVNEGGNFSFSCNNTAIDATIGYEVNGETIGDIFLRVIPGPSGFVRSFNFPNVTRDDNGTMFTCSGAPQQPVTVILIVHYPGQYDQPSFVRLEQFVNTQLTVDLTLEEGFPATKYSWEFNGNPLDSSDRISLSQTSLQITDLMLSDNGTYTVTANNTAGSTTATFSVIVFVGPILTQSNGSTIDVTITAGDSFTVDCTASQSVPEVMSYTVIVNGNSMPLTNPMRTFNNLMPSDSGVYRCWADSGKAISYFDYSLTVELAPSTSTTTNTMGATVSPTPGSGSGIIISSKYLLAFVLIGVAFFYFSI